IGVDRPRTAGRQHQASRWRDDVIRRNLFDQARALELAARIDLDVGREGNAEVLEKPVGGVGKRQSENAGVTVRRQPVAIEIDGCSLSVHRIGLIRIHTYYTDELSRASRNSPPVLRCAPRFEACPPSS